MKLSTTTHDVLRQLVVSIFAVGTTTIFFYMNNVQPNYYIDEIFHIPQTLRFCDGNFTEWDQKITTFPGLYLIAVAVLAPFNLCTTFFLRGVNLLATFANLYVIHELIKSTCDTEEKKKRGKIDERKKWNRLLTSLNIALLPPLYFLLFLFYTDVVSTNMVLLMYLLYLKRKFKTSAFVGVLAVLLRQTNVVWVAWLTMERGMDIVENKNPRRIQKSMKNSPAYIKLLWYNIKEESDRGRFVKFMIETILALLPYILIIINFAIFVILNKGIVLGDRTAHTATIHIPQIFYYSIFACFFSWPYFLPYLTDYSKLIKNRWFSSALVFAAMGMIVRFNTLAHPYLLADNRHYTFYVWNRIIARYYLARYLLVPVYGFCFYSLWRGISDLRFLSQIGYFFTLFVVLVPQLLLEPRYFFIPYILFRINIRRPETWQILAETSMTLMVNVFQFFVFSNKVFYWDDDVNPQRISW